MWVCGCACVYTYTAFSGQSSVPCLYTKSFFFNVLFCLNSESQHLFVWIQSHSSEGPEPWLTHLVLCGFYTSHRTKVEEKSLSTAHVSASLCIHARLPFHPVNKQLRSPSSTIPKNELLRNEWQTLSIVYNPVLRPSSACLSSFLWLSYLSTLYKEFIKCYSSVPCRLLSKVYFLSSIHINEYYLLTILLSRCPLNDTLNC